MDSNRIVSGVVKLLVLLVALGALWFIWGEQFNHPGEAEPSLGATHVTVETSTIQKTTLRSWIVTYGTVIPAPATKEYLGASASVGATFPGVVHSVNCSEGKTVKRGDTLFTIESYNNDPRLTVTNFNSPIDGTVTTINIAAGEIIDRSKVAVQVVDLNRLLVEAATPAEELSLIQPGQQAMLDPGGIQSSVIRVDPAVDPATGLGTVDLDLPDNVHLHPGQFMKCGIVREAHKDVLAVPAASLVRIGTDDVYVGVVSDDGRKAVLQPVQVGIRENDLVEISGANLSSGMRIVTTGSSALVARTDIVTTKPSGN